MPKYLSYIVLLLNFIFSQDWVVDLNKRYSPAVVTVICYDLNSNQLGHGSGFNIDKSGIIVTNEHVISNPEIARVQIRFQDKEIFDVSGILYENKTKDLALLKIDGYDLPIVKLGNSNNVMPGEEVVTIGSPLEVEFSGTITTGNISQIRNLDGTKYLQMSAGITFGNSGGPLFNSKGEVIGVTTAGRKDYKMLNYSLAINYVRGAIKNANSIIREFSPETATIPTTGIIQFVTDLDSVRIILTSGEPISLGYLPMDIPPLPSGGPYTYIALKDRYGYSEGQFYIANGRTTKEKIIIKRNLSKLKITSNKRNVDIFLDNEYLGKTPLTTHKREGNYNIIGKKDDFEDINEKVYVFPPNDKVVTLNFTSLEIITSPKGATVNLEGEYKGITPLIINNLSLGSKLIQIEKDGYVTEKKTLSISSDQTDTLKLDLVELSSLTLKGKNIESSTIMLGNKVLDYSFNFDKNRYDVGPNKYELKVIKAGFEDFKKELILNEGDEKTININLILKMVELNIDRRNAMELPEGGIFEIKNSYGAIFENNGSNQVWELPYGDYKLLIKHVDYLTFKRNFKIDDDWRKELSIELKPKAPIIAQIKSLKIKRNLSLFIGTTLIGAGTYLKVLANQQYDEYKTATNNANDLRESINKLDKNSPFVIGAGGIFYLVPLHYHNKISPLQRLLE